MAFWEREKEAKKVIPKTQDCQEAKYIDAEMIKHMDCLTMGWYFYKQDYLWHGLRPNQDQTAFEKGYDFSSLRDLQKWLGIPVPAEILEKEENRESPEAQRARIRRQSASAEHPDQDLPACTPAYNRKRDIDIHIKVTPQEYEEFRQRVEESGMTKTNYLIRCALQNKQVEAVSRDHILQEVQAITQMLQSLLADVGRQGGLLKMAVNPNREKQELCPEEWSSLIKAVQNQEKLKKKIERTLASVNGYFKTLNL